MIFNIIGRRTLSTQFLFLFTFFTVDAAADFLALQGLFQKTFYSSLYTRGKCGNNIFNFIKIAKQNRVSLKTTYILEISPTGHVHLEGMVPFQARNTGGRPPGTSMWRFHAVLESNGYIFDFDFTNEPRVLPVAQYFETMFYPRHGRTSYAAKADFPKRIRADYKITKVPAMDYIRYLEKGSRSGQVYPYVTLENYLR